VRLGRGEKPDEALAEMTRLEQTVEGVPATGLAMTLVSQRASDIAGQLPLLFAINDILQGKVSDVLAAVTQAVLPVRP
ncbi:MAG: NAD(P)H-dependent glycerol-3-phosphate dehydrogenase, partial [Ancrocorticia populi]